MKDFFTRYRESRKNPVILPAFIALSLSFLLVANIEWTPINLKGISANVAGSLEQEVVYPADLILERNGNALDFVIGKNAENVKSLHFSLLGNPSVFLWANSLNANTTITSNEPGVILVQVTLNKSMKAWEKVTQVVPTLSWETPIAIIDAGFSSETGEYMLSTHGE